MRACVRACVCVCAEFRRSEKRGVESLAKGLHLWETQHHQNYMFLLIAEVGSAPFEHLKLLLRVFAFVLITCTLAFSKPAASSHKGV